VDGRREIVEVVVQLGLGERQKGIEDFNQALVLDPMNIYTRWIGIWAMINENRVNAATEIANELEKITNVRSDSYIMYICRGVILGLRGSLKEGLEELEKAIQLAPEEWDSYFWKGMICAYLGQNQKAQESFGWALNQSLPPILLTPLRWFKQDRPDFYDTYAAPLLAEYNML
jgi:tetratricopeptide (TPR) repeat protein